MGPSSPDIDFGWVGFFYSLICKFGSQLWRDIIKSLNCVGENLFLINFCYVKYFPLNGVLSTLIFVCGSIFLHQMAQHQNRN